MSENCLELGTFSGACNENFKKFVSRFDCLALANEWNNDRKRDMFPLFLCGAAEEFYEDILEVDELAYCQLVEKLESHFCSMNLADLYWKT